MFRGLPRPQSVAKDRTARRERRRSARIPGNGGVARTASVDLPTGRTTAVTRKRKQDAHRCLEQLQALGSGRTADKRPHPRSSSASTAGPTRPTVGALFAFPLAIALKRAIPVGFPAIHCPCRTGPGAAWTDGTLAAARHPVECTITMPKRGTYARHRCHGR